MQTVNVLDKTPTHYCGRETSYRKQYGIDMSILGNPFPLPQYTRTRSIAEYRKWLNHQRLIKSKVWQELTSLPSDAVLGCFCKPKACHCDIIIDAHTWHHNK